MEKQGVGERGVRPWTILSTDNVGSKVNTINQHSKGRFLSWIRWTLFAVLKKGGFPFLGSSRTIHESTRNNANWEFLFGLLRVISWIVLSFSAASWIPRSEIYQESISKFLGLSLNALLE